MQPNTTAGPGASIQTQVNPDPMLWTVGDESVVQVFNPLTVDFVGLVGQSKPINAPFQVRKTVGAEAPTTDENQVQSAYGITLKNPEHFSPAQITTQVVLPAGKTTSLMGGVAKVVVTQLVNEILQREDNKLKMADPTARHGVEQRVVKSVRSVNDLLPSMETRQDQIDNVLGNLNNQGGNDEQNAFPGATSPGTNGPDSPTPGTTEDSPKRGPGRPPKS